MIAVVQPLPSLMSVRACAVLRKVYPIGVPQQDSGSASLFIKPLSHLEL